MKIEPDRIMGTLLGLAAGDRIGGPLQMALTLAESLIERWEFDPADIGRRYLAWWRASGFDTGPTAAGVFRLVEQGKSYQEAAEIVNYELEGMTAGCNPLHRCPPLPLCPCIPDGALNQASKSEARLTHFHPTAGEGAALVTELIRGLILGKSWKESLFTSAKGQPDWVVSIISSKVPPLSKSGYTPDVLQAAMYFLHTSENFPEALKRSLDFAGPANYSPVLVGSLAGARWGANAIPASSYQHNAEHIDLIIQLAKHFSNQWENRE